MVVNIFYKTVLREKLLEFLFIFLQVLCTFYNVHTRIVNYVDLWISKDIWKAYLKMFSAGMWGLKSWGPLFYTRRSLKRDHVLLCPTKFLKWCRREKKGEGKGSWLVFLYQEDRFRLQAEVYMCIFVNHLCLLWTKFILYFATSKIFKHPEVTMYDKK